MSTSRVHQVLDDDRREAERKLVDQQQLRAGTRSALPSASICRSPPDSRPPMRLAELAPAAGRTR